MKGNSCCYGLLPFNSGSSQTVSTWLASGSMYCRRSQNWTEKDPANQNQILPELLPPNFHCTHLHSLNYQRKQAKHNPKNDCLIGAPNDLRKDPPFLHLQMKSKNHVANPNHACFHFTFSDMSPIFYQAFSPFNISVLPFLHSQ